MQTSSPSRRETEGDGQRGSGGDGVDDVCVVSLVRRSPRRWSRWERGRRVDGDEVMQRRARFGPNALPVRRVSVWSVFGRQFANPVQVLVPGSGAELATIDVNGHDLALMIRDHSVDNPVLLARWPPAKLDSTGTATSSVNPIVDDHLIDIAAMIIMRVSVIAGARSQWSPGTAGYGEPADRP